MTRARKAVQAFALFAVLLTGCSGRDGQEAPEGGSVTGSDTASGIVSFAPNITETVFALGEGERVIAVTDFCTWPPEARALPKVGGYINPDLEKIALLNPAMIIVLGEHDKLTDFSRINNIQLVRVDMATGGINTIEDGILKIGEALGVGGRASLLWTEISSELAAVSAAVEDRVRPTVLLIMGRSEHDLDTLFTTGGASYISELVDIAGGDNVFAAETTAYFEASKEPVVMSSPDVIIEFHAGEKMSEADEARYKSDWNKMPSLPAVQEGRLHIVTEEFTTIGGPRIGKTARLLARLLHPGIELAEP